MMWSNTYEAIAKYQQKLKETEHDRDKWKAEALIKDFVVQEQESNMKLYLIKAKFNVSWDDYDSAVVVAPDEETARLMHPSDGLPINDGSNMHSEYSGWTNDPKMVEVVYLGVADKRLVKNLSSGVICASYNAG